MLVLSRKAGESIRVGDDVVITINRINKNRVSIGIQAPDGYRVLRGELEDFGFQEDDFAEATVPGPLSRRMKSFPVPQRSAS